MKKFYKISALILMVCMLCSLTGCFRTEVEVEIKNSESGSLTVKLAMREDLYLGLLSNQGEGDEGTTWENTDEQATESEESVDLSEFVFDQELSDTLGERYYSYSAVKDNITLDELVNELYKIEFSDGKSIFREIEIQITQRRNYIFEATTNVIKNDNLTPDDNTEIPDDWFALSMTVKMPGEVTETTGTIIGDATDGKVRFFFDNFTEAKTLYVKTEPIVSMTPLYVLWGVGGAAIVFCLVMFVRSRKKLAKAAEVASAAEENIRESEVDHETQDPQA